MDAPCIPSCHTAQQAFGVKKKINFYSLKVCKGWKKCIKIKQQSIKMNLTAGKKHKVRKK